MILALIVPKRTFSAQDSILELLVPNMIKAAEMKYDLPSRVLQALIQVESAGNYAAMNHDDGNKSTKRKGLRVKSFGLVQIQLETARFMQKEKAKSTGEIITKKNQITTSQLIRPEINIEYGAMYIKWLLSTHDNDISWALTCYNSGHASRMCTNKIYYGKYVGKVLNEMVKLK